MKRRQKIYSPYVRHTSSNPLGARHFFLAIFVLITFAALDASKGCENVKQTSDCYHATLPH